MKKHSAWDKFVFGEKFLDNLDNQIFTDDEFMTKEETIEQRTKKAGEYLYNQLGFSLFTTKIIVAKEKLAGILNEIKNKYDIETSPSVSSIYYFGFGGFWTGHLDFLVEDVYNKQEALKIRVTRITYNQG